MSFALMLLSGTRGTAVSVIGPADAVAQACAAPKAWERLGQCESLRITAEFNEQCSVWMVQFFQDDQRVAFSTVSLAGEVKEIGPGESESAGANIASESRRHQLLHELEAAQEAGNEAEVREILELLERLDTPVRVGGRRTDTTSRLPAQSTLPVYEMSLPEDGVRQMLTEVTEEITVRGKLGFDGESYPVEVRLRGASTRYAAKKSYRVRFLEGSPLPRKVTYLKAEPMDHTMQQEKLSCDVFRAAGARVSDADYISLFLNGRYEGVYLDIEPIRSPFKKKLGLGPKGTLIRAGTFQHLAGREPLGELRGDQGSLDELRRFLWQVNRVERGDFEAFVRTQTDWPRLRDYLALQVICHRTEIEADDYFFYRDRESARWSLIPWDHNNGNWAVSPYANRVGEPTISLFVQTLQDIGWRPNHWFVLPSRIFNNDPLRREYLARLEQLTRELLLSDVVNDLIETNYHQLRPDYPHDPYRADWEGEDPFLCSDQDLKAFAKRHGKRLLSLIENAREPSGSHLVLNEFAFGTKAGWIELLNQGQEPIELSDYSLATRTSRGNHEYPLEGPKLLYPGDFEVIRIPRQSIREAEGPVDIAKANAHTALLFPGFDPGGGFIALVRTERASSGSERDKRAESVQDFLFYGPQLPGRSYGRWRGGFSRLEPTPGEKNVRN